MRRKSIGTITAAAAIALMAAAPAHATVYQFAGDKGTLCSVDVGAAPQTGGGGVTLPQVGFSAVPECTYARPGTGSAGGGGATPPLPAQPAGGVYGAAAKKSCKKKRSARAKKRCKRRRKRGAKAAAAAAAGSSRAVVAVANPATMDGARLNLNLSLLGLPIFFGDKTITSLTLGYSCVLDEGAECADRGVLLPAVPLLAYNARFIARINPPGGESWVSRPPVCDTNGACTMDSEPVIPTVLG